MTAPYNPNETRDQRGRWSAGGAAPPGSLRYAAQRIMPTLDRIEQTRRQSWGDAPLDDEDLRRFAEWRKAPPDSVGYAAAQIMSTLYGAPLADTGRRKTTSADDSGDDAEADDDAGDREEPASKSQPDGHLVMADMEVPKNILGGPYTAAPGQKDGIFHGPRQPSGPRTICRWVPANEDGGPPGSQGYWKTQAPGQKGWSRFDRNGYPLTAEEAHPNPLPPNPLSPLLRFGGAGGAFLGTWLYSNPAY